MARKRRSRGLGWVPAEHKKRQRTIAGEIAGHVKDAREYLRDGDCRNAMDKLVYISQLRGQYNAQEEAQAPFAYRNDPYGGRAASRDWGLQRSVYRLGKEVHACYVKHIPARRRSK